MKNVYLDNVDDWCLPLCNCYNNIEYYSNWSNFVHRYILSTIQWLFIDICPAACDCTFQKNGPLEDELLYNFQNSSSRGQVLWKPLKQTHHVAQNLVLLNVMKQYDILVSLSLC